MRLAANITVALLLSGCSSGTVARPPATVTEAAWPTVSACLEALRGAPLGRGGADQACVRIDFVNASSSIFILHALHIELDDVVLFSGRERGGGRGALADTRAFTVFLDRFAAGEHELRVDAWLLPDAAAAPYLRGYRWEVRSTHRFTPTPGGGFGLNAIFYERRDDKRGRKAPPEEWPAVRYQEGSVTPGNDRPPKPRDEASPKAGPQP